MDYGHELEFGAFLTPDAAHLDQLLENAQLADVLGLDLVCLCLLYTSPSPRD